MNNFVIGIAGGSGSGKSTLAFNLLDTWPDKSLVFHIDDYFKPESDVPKVQGITNWDSPEALYVEKMVHDLGLLKHGQSAVINTKSPRLNPTFLQTGKRIPIEFQPKPLIIVEGFLSLHLEAIRKLLDLKIYLEAPFELHISRRIHGKLHNFPAEYDEVVLKPMHEQFVLPSKRYADEIIEISKLSENEVLKKVIGLIGDIAPNI